MSMRTAFVVALAIAYFFGLAVGYGVGTYMSQVLVQDEQKP